MIKNVKNIYWMLAYAFRTLNEQYIEEKVKYENFENIYDLFCVMLSQSISKQLKRGLNKEYILKCESISALKGKIDVIKSIRLNELNKKKIYCEYDEYSENSYMNRILKTAAMSLIKSGKIKNNKRKNELKKVMIYFNDVSCIKRKFINWNFLKYNRNNKTYKMLMSISYLILEGLIINKSDGHEEFTKFIDDQKMYVLYEKFILEYYRYHYPEFSPRLPEIKWNVEDKDKDSIYLLPKMKTDTVLKYKNHELIIDSKYYSKVLQSNPLFKKEKIRNANLYQMFTYVKNEDVKKDGTVLGMLLYAKTYEDDIDWQEYKIDGNIIVITNIDLEQEFDQIKNQLDNIAKWFKNKCNE